MPQTENPAATRNSDDVLIVGGYGIVGQQVAAELAPDYGGRVVVAGRHLAEAQRLAASLGHAVRGRRIDVDDPASIETALHGVGVVVSCVNQGQPHLLNAAIAHGLGYTDITPQLMTRRPTPAIKSRAIETGARIILGAGLAPGLSSMFARLAADRAGVVDSVESNVLISVGDAHGLASRQYLLEELTMPFTALVAGRLQSFTPFVGAAPVVFPAPLGLRKAYRFPLSDQVFFPETLGARTAVARIVLNPPWLGTLLSLLLRSGLLSVTRRGAGTSHVLQKLGAWLKQKYAGLDWYGLVVEVRGSRASVRASLVGHGQARATAIGAALLARALIEGEVERAGIWLAEEIVPMEPFFRRLAAHGLVPSVEEQLHGDPLE